MHGETNELFVIFEHLFRLKKKFEKKKYFKYLNFNLKFSFLSEKNRTNDLYCFRSNHCMYKMFVIQLFPNNSISLFTSIILEYLTNMDWRDSVMLGLLGFFFWKTSPPIFEWFHLKKIGCICFFFIYIVWFFQSYSFTLVDTILRSLEEDRFYMKYLCAFLICITATTFNIVPTTRKVVPSSFSWTAVVVFVLSSVLI